MMTEPPSVSFESVFILGEHRLKKKKKERNSTVVLTVGSRTDLPAAAHFLEPTKVKSVLDLRDSGPDALFHVPQILGPDKKKETEQGWQVEEVE